MVYYTYEEYIALSGDEQYAYYQQFESASAFFEWYNQAKLEYEESQDRIEIGGDDSIDIGEIIGGRSE